MKTKGNYHNLQLKRDVLLLADVLKKIRNLTFKNYWLLTSHYLSASALSWDAMFGISKFELELISDANIFL